MTQLPLAAHLAESPRIGDEITVTGKWVPARKGGIFRKSPDSGEMLAEWEAIHADAKADDGVLSTEINHAVGQDAVLVNHVFGSGEAMANYFAATATRHADVLKAVAKPELHLVRGIKVPAAAREAITSKGVRAAIGEWRYGYIKDDYRQPDPDKAIQVTAKWTCKPGESVDALEMWWQKVGTDAYDMEKGLLRFETYRVAGEEALIIHETFSDTDELKFHLTKGTANIYKKDIDAIAAPECYFFRGPVSWTIRTYSKFMHLPATYSSQGSHFTQRGGTMSEGLIGAV